MKRLYKLFLCVFICVVILLLDLCSVFAYENHNITEQEQIEIPDNLYLEINDTCSGHKFFEQADVSSKGDFVVFCSEVVYKSETKTNIYRNFVDIYDSCGDLICELSFRKCICAVRISDECVFIIFKNNVLVFDIQTKEIQFYDTTDLNLLQNDAAEILQLQNFTSGNYRYKMSAGLFFKDGYNKLIKYSENQKEVILEYSMDFGYFVKQTITYVVLFLACTFPLAHFMRRRKKKAE